MRRQGMAVGSEGSIATTIRPVGLAAAAGPATPRSLAPPPATRRAWLRASSTILASVVATACAGSAAPQPSGSPQARTPVTVRVHARTGSEDEAFEKRLAEFNQQNGNNITAVYEGLGDYFN